MVRTPTSPDPQGTQGSSQLGQAGWEGAAGYLGVGLLSLPLQEPELLLLLREEAPWASRTLTGGEVRLEAGRRGRCSFWLVGSRGHWANTARPLRPKGPPLQGHRRGEKHGGGMHRQG